MWFDNHKDIELTKELYKCHFTPLEASEIVGKSYQVMINLYRGLRMANIKKYDRLTLSDWEGFRNDVAING